MLLLLPTSFIFIFFFICSANLAHATDPQVTLSHPTPATYRAPCTAICSHKSHFFEFDEDEDPGAIFRFLLAVLVLLLPFLEEEEEEAEADA